MTFRSELSVNVTDEASRIRKQWAGKTLPDVVWLKCFQCDSTDLIVTMELLTLYADEVTVQCLQCNAGCHVIEEHEQPLFRLDDDAFLDSIFNDERFQYWLKVKLGWLTDEDEPEDEDDEDPV